MKAISFNPTALSFFVGKSLGKITDAAFFGGLSSITYGTVAEPAIPKSDWVRLEILKAGICGTDVGGLSFHAAPTLEPFGSFPAVLGHEILARVIEVGSDVSRIKVGQRVMVDPLISCRVRGFSEQEQCSSCLKGLPGTCERAGEQGKLQINDKQFQRGASIGYHATLTGGWGERMIAHESQLHPVDDTINDSSAVLIEPISVGMHAALRERPFSEGPILVIGSGPIALGTIWALRAAGYEGEVVAQVEKGKATDIAKKLGASVVIPPGYKAREALINTGAKAYKPIVGDEVYAGGGFPLIFDCVGSKQTIEQSIRYASSGARIALLGCAYEISKLDLTFVWARELTITGYVGYGIEEWHGKRQHTFQVTHDLLLETAANIEQIVTHIFPLAQYHEALSIAANHQKKGSIKVLFDPSLS